MSELPRRPDPEIDHDYLSNKRRGGDSNQRGGRYERLFAVSKIVELAAFSWQDIDTIQLCAQVYAYVDDLCIWHGKEVSYHQMKSGAVVSWGQEAKGSLRYDFQEPMRISIANNEIFRMSLVVHSEEIAVKLTAELPSTIAEATSVVCFPDFGTTLELVSHPPIRALLLQLCAVQDASLDWLDAIAKFILGIWDGTGHGKIALGAIVDQLRQLPGALVRSRLEIPISRQLRAVLGQVLGFNYWEEGGYLRWRFGSHDAGIVAHPIGSPEFSTVEDSILKSRPLDFHNLEPLIA